jgi:hypothetical protein
LNRKKDYGFLFFDSQAGKYAIISFTPIFVDDKPGFYQDMPEKFLASISKTRESLQAFGTFFSEFH